jgi:hypothetical protein
MDECMQVEASGVRGQIVNINLTSPLLDYWILVIDPEKNLCPEFTFA